MEERFTYDNLNRLTGIVEGLDTTGVFAYDAYGRMTSKYLCKLKFTYLCYMVFKQPNYYEK